MRLADGDAGPDPVDELQAVPRKAIRAHASESNYQYGIKRGAPRLLKLLKKYDVAATFTAAAVALERAPDLAQAIVDASHEVCCHGYRWIHQYEMTEAEERDFIRKAWQSLEKTTGARPKGWLSRYLHTDNTRRLLVEEGFDYHMDDFSDDVPFWDQVEMEDGGKRPLAIVPYALDTNDMKFWLDPSYAPDDWLRYAAETFDWLYEEGSEAPRMMSLGLHLRIIGRPGRIGALERFLAHVDSKPDVWIARRADIAAHFAKSVPPPS